tara:strand:- start:17 stop:268 length:252 start_codon:yes stop_codon:yes gene_type:complete
MKDKKIALIGLGYFSLPLALAFSEKFNVIGFGRPLFYNNVVKVLWGNVESESDGSEGLKSLEIIIAAYLSTEDGRAISLPLER